MLKEMIKKHKDNNAKDISFVNIFFKRFVIMIIITIPFMIWGYNVAKSYSQEKHELLVRENVTNMALSLAEMEDSKKSGYKTVLLENVQMSEYYEKLKENEFIMDASLSFYDLSNRNVIAKSYEIPVIYDEEALDWWRQQADDDDGLPTITLSNEMLAFCQKHRNKKILLENVTCVNSVICPAKVVVVNEKGEEVDNCATTTPTDPNMSKYEEKIEMKLIGNSSDDKLYLIMNEYDFVLNEIKEEQHESMVVDITQQQVKYESVVKYPDKLSDNNITLVTKNFTINEVDYQLDCTYQFNFWAGAWQTVALVEFFAILGCAVIAFITTKDSFNIFG